VENKAAQAITIQHWTTACLDGDSGSRLVTAFKSSVAAAAGSK
jgi:hypothetical protein